MCDFRHKLNLLKRNSLSERPPILCTTAQNQKDQANGHELIWLFEQQLLERASQLGVFSVQFPTELPNLEHQFADRLGREMIRK